MMAPAQKTRSVPKRRRRPGEGLADAPHIRFWMAMVSERMSRVQPFSVEIGMRNMPTTERGPNDRRPMRQPHRTMTKGVRQASEAGRSVGAEAVMGGSGRRAATR